jgi:hypothetical protein
LQTTLESSENILTIIDPKNNQQINKNGISYTVVTSIKNPQDVSVLKLFVQKATSPNKIILGEVMNPSSSFVTLDWNIQESGIWIISAEAKVKNSTETLSTAGTVVTVNNTLGSEDTQSTIYNPQNSLDLFKKQ